MTIFNTDEAKQEAKDLAVKLGEKADTTADSLLDKLKGSKWTAAIVVGAVLLIGILFYLK